MLQGAMVQRFLLFVVLLTLTFSIGAVSAQDALEPGDIVLVVVGRMPVRTAPAMDGPIAAEVLRGMRSRIVAVEEDGDGRRWLYLENNAFGWVLETIEGEPTVILYSDSALEQIITDATAVIEANPNDVQAYVERGTAYLTQRDYEAAIADYTSAINLAPEDYRLYEYRGKVNLDSGSYDQVVRDVGVTFSAGEPTGMTYIRAALAYLNQNNFPNSLASYYQALDAAPTFGLVNNNMGALFHTYGMYEDALAAYTQAIAKDPYLAVAYANRALTYMELGDNTAALNDLDMAVEIDPYYVDGYIRRAVFYAEVNQDWGANLENLNQAIAISPDDDSAYSQRAITYLFLGDHERAIDDLKHALELNPTDATSNFRLGTIYAGLERYDEAVESYTNAINVPTEHFYDTDALLYRGQTYMALGDYPNALADMDGFLAGVQSDNPNNVYFMATSYLIRANAKAALGDYNGAVEDYNAARSISVDFVASYYQYGAGFRVTNSRETLIAELQQQLSAQPDDAQLHLRLALLHLEFGQWQQAIEQFRRYGELVSVTPEGFDTFVSTLESLT